MPVTTTHPEYDENLERWSRARDLLRGEDAVKAAGERYLPRLQEQSDADYAAYKMRGSFFNATARTAEGFCGLVFRRPPFIKLPDPRSGIGRALAAFHNDADLLGSTLPQYAKSIVSEVIGLGRAGTLVDFEGQESQRAYAVRYAAESILNWRCERIGGRHALTLLVLHEPQGGPPAGETEGDEFRRTGGEQIRVFKLATAPQPAVGSHACVMELWRPVPAARNGGGQEWRLAEQSTPLRRGRPLPLIPFVFHGPRHAWPRVDKPPLEDLMAVNLDHYRLDTDYKHGLHYTALPTAWVTGFHPGTPLRIGSTTAWVTESTNASAGFLEFKGQGLQSFEHALERDERLMALLGSRLLESPKRVGETAEAISLRQSGEDSILGGVATSLSASLSQVLRWVYWWHSTETYPEDVGAEQAVFELNTDFSTAGLTARELQALVNSWQNRAISRDTLLNALRRGEIVPDGRSNAEEKALIEAEGEGKE